MAKTLGIAEQGLGMGKQVMADCDRLRALKVGVSRHHPACMPAGLGGESVDHPCDRRHELGCRDTAVQAEVERDLVVARAAGVQGGAGRRDLGEPALDSRVDVLVRVEEDEFTLVQLALDPAKATLDRGESRPGQKT